MQTANPNGYTAEYGAYRLSSPVLTEAEHDVAIRRIDGLPHKKIARELEYSENNSKKTSQRVMDKLIPPANIHDNQIQPRTVQELIKALLERKELILRVLSIAEVSWVLSFLSSVEDTGATALLFSLTAKAK